MLQNCGHSIACERGMTRPLTKPNGAPPPLLNKYPDPKDQGRIYFALVQVYGQSGLARPQRIIDGVRKALQLPLDPSHRIRLYVYWGEALCVLAPGDPFSGRRRAATTVYLEGLMELRKFNLPEKPPEIPVVDLHGFDGETAG